MARNNESSSKAYWNDELVKIFCNVCIIEIKRGNRPGTHFTPNGWANVVLKFKEASGMEYDKAQLKNKWDQLKKDWKIWKQLKSGFTGFVWSSKKNTLDASDEWWKEKLEVLPNAGKFKRSGIPPNVEDLLDEMYAGIASAPVHALSLNYGMQPLVLTETTHREGTGSSGNSQDDPTGNPVIASPSKIKCKWPSNDEAALQIQRRISVENSYLCPAQIPQVYESPLDMSAKASYVNVNRKPGTGTSIGEAMDVVKAMPEVIRPSDFYFFVTKLLTSDSKREIFMCLDPEERFWWLRREEADTIKNATT